MLELSLAERREPLRMLFLGAHADDIEIGCGGAVLELLERCPGASATWVVFSSPGPRAAEARASARDFLEHAKTSDVRVLDFRESYFPYIGAQVKEAVEALAALAPDLIFTHHRADLHQDHRLIAELTWNTFRNHLILEYEIPKYDGDLGHPNVFVSLDEARCREKCRLIQKHFVSQRARQWFDERMFMGLMRIRGVECRSATGYAEAFHGRKLQLR